MITEKFTFAQREEGFDNHIEQSIRGYNHLIDDVINLSQYFVENVTNVYDIGCSTGKMITRMAEQNKKFAPHAQYVGIEMEESFFEQLREAEKNNIQLYIEYKDVRAVQFYNASLVTSIFTLQFISENDRQEIINHVWKSLNPGGGFIFAEKTRADCSKIHEMRTFTYYDYKRQNFEYDDIMNKEKLLRSMMKPNTREELTNMCYKAGFRVLDSFWQNHAFTGFIAIK